MTRSAAKLAMYLLPIIGKLNSLLQCVAVCCSACVAVRCVVVQYVAVCCRVENAVWLAAGCEATKLTVAVRCSVLQCMCCRVLQSRKRHVSCCRLRS